MEYAERTVVSPYLGRHGGNKESSCLEWWAPKMFAVVAIMCRGPKKYVGRRRKLLYGMVKHESYKSSSIQ